MEIKDDKLTGLIIISIIYILTSIIGIYTYSKLIHDYPFYINLLISDTISTIFCFIFSTLLSNSSIYDPYWSIQPIVIILSYILYYNNSKEITLIFISILFWGIRLTLNWVYTFKNLKIQDWRYDQIKNQTGIFYPFVNFIGIHYVPTLIVYFCILPPIYLILYQNNNKNNLLSIIFLICSFLSTLLEAEADREMHIFKKKNDTNTFIRNGLWKYSRHPNYLGEILFWWFIALYCVIILKGFYFILIGPFLNTLLFIFISIPLADNHQKRKKGFDVYYKETRMLLPFKK